MGATNLMATLELLQEISIHAPAMGATKSA